MILAGLCACLGPATAPDNSDPAIKARAARVMQNQKNLDLRIVAVAVDDRVVTLSGVVKSHEDKMLLGDAVRRVPGVKRVILNIIIQE